MRLLRRAFVVAALSAAGVGLAPGCGKSSSPTGTPSAADPGTVRHPLEGAAAPDFTLDAPDGSKVRLADAKGSVVVLDFWATWCAPCRKSFPHLQELANNASLAARGLKVVAVDAQEGKAEVAAFLKENGYTLPVALDADGTVGKKYHVEGYPTTMVVGRDGTIRKVFYGFNPETSPKEFDAAVRAALNAP